MSAPDDTPRDWRWHDAPRPDPDTGRAPLMPGAEADDVPALLREADAFCRDWEHAALRLALVADQAAVIRRLSDDLARVTAERDRHARRIRGARAVLDGAAVAAAPGDANSGEPCGWTAR